MFAAVLTGVLYVVCAEALGLSAIPSTAIAFLCGFGFRIISHFLGWEVGTMREPAVARASQSASAPLGVGQRAELTDDATRKTK